MRYIEKALKLIKADKELRSYQSDFLWFNDDEMNRILDFGVKIGFFNRLSVTQFELTERGAKAISEYLN